MPKLVVTSPVLNHPSLQLRVFRPLQIGFLLAPPLALLRRAGPRVRLDILQLTRLQHLVRWIEPQKAAMEPKGTQGNPPNSAGHSLDPWKPRKKQLLNLLLSLKGTS